MNNVARVLWMCLLTLVSVNVHAHGDAAWTHGVVEGATTFFTALEYMLLGIGAALLASRKSFDVIRIATLFIFAGFLVGLSMRFMVTELTYVTLAARSLLIILGVAILTDLSLPKLSTYLLAFLTGGLMSLEFSLKQLQDPPLEVTNLIGFGVTAIAFFTLSGFYMHRFQTGWQRIAIRVVGSWLAAIGAIYCALFLKQPQLAVVLG